MRKTGSPKLLFEKVDLSPVRPILWWGLHQEGPGRPVEYDPEWDLRALMLRQPEQRKIRHLIPWRRLKGRKIPPGVLSVKNRIQVDGPEHMRVIFGRLRAGVEGFISRLKRRLNYDQFTWRGLENAGIHTSLAFCVVYAVAIAALKLGRPDLMGSISYFA